MVCEYLHDYSPPEQGSGFNYYITRGVNKPECSVCEMYEKH